MHVIELLVPLAEKIKEFFKVVDLTDYRSIFLHTINHCAIIMMCTLKEYTLKIYEVYTLQLKVNVFWLYVLQ